MDFWKYPNEKFEIEMDFSSLLGASETISTATVTAYDKDGTDVSATLLDGATKTIDGGSIKIQVQAGTAGERYKIVFQADTSVPQTFKEKSLCEVKEL